MSGSFAEYVNSPRDIAGGEMLMDLCKYVGWLCASVQASGKCVSGDRKEDSECMFHLQWFPQKYTDVPGHLTDFFPSVVKGSRKEEAGCKGDHFTF